jgi:glutamyl-tRNA reductase
MDVGPTIGAMREKMHEVARAEMARQRKRLGALTPEQETAIEALLMSTVNKISHPILNQMRRFYETNETDDVQQAKNNFDLEE